MGELGRAHGQVLKKSTLKIGQAGSKNQDLKQTPVHEEEGRIARHRPQEGEVIIPASLNEYLVRVIRVCQLHLALQSNDNHRKGEGGLTLMNIVLHPLIANNGRWGWWQSNAMATSHTGRCPNVPIASPCSPEVEGGRITMTEIGSLDGETTKDVPSRGGERCLHQYGTKPPNLSEWEDSLSEAPWRVFSKEELPMEMTSRSIKDCWIYPSESSPPMPMVKSNRNEDMIR